MDITYVGVFFLTSVLLQSKLECRELDGYSFPVYTTENCPKNEQEWNQRSAVFNCSKEQTYACFPNNEITDLIEFCYPLPIIAIPADLCLYLSKKRSQMDAYECKGFEYGCPDKPYRGSWIFHYSACVSIGEGCFLAEPLCRRATRLSYWTTTQQESTKVTETISQPTVSGNNTTRQMKQGVGETQQTGHWIVVALVVLLVITFSVLLLILKKRSMAKQQRNNCYNEEDPNNQEMISLLNADDEVENVRVKNPFHVTCSS
uniref:Uncharacterized protein LOC111100872 isoform X2 n=1 Tax=Crassostrea virginica TaxID=6565 RepID=A0A8B8ADZ1_CRAVI|nr:uncharacterized protein LOC111100872 isoform X2 [Crassostrea virginica]XP_022288714.1 uncharacterized protein LOC111100872 isoform X2 [Crassostrea virginica]